MPAKKSEKQKKSFPFTKDKLKKLQPPPAVKGSESTAKELYYDTGSSYLALRITSNGVKSFVAYRWDPKRKRTDRTTLGQFSPDAFKSSEFERDPLSFMGSNPLLSVEMARELAAAVIGSKQDFKGQKRSASGELTLSELFEEYMTRHMDKSKKTGEETRRNFERHLHHWKKRKLSLITQKYCEELHGCIGKEKGVYAANRCIQMLRAMFNKAKSWKLFLGDNPAQGITLFKERPRERFLSEDEVQRLFKALDDAPRDTRDLVFLSLFTGTRKMNACSMAWKDLNLKEQIWTIPDTKSGGTQTINLVPDEVKILESRKKYLAQMGKLGTWVFPSNSKKGHLLDPKTSWTTLRKKAGIEDLHFHDLRRSLGSWMASGNTNVALIQSALGHKDVKTTIKHYARAKKDALREAREAVHKKMKAAASKPTDENVANLKKRTY